MLGDKPFAIFSNSALVITVLQSAAGVLEAADSAECFEAGAVVLSDAVFAEIVLEAVEHTPFMVNTGASGGTEAEVSTGAAGACAAAVFPPGVWPACGEGAGGATCPQARAPSSTHMDQLLRIDNFLQDGHLQKV